MRHLAIAYGYGTSFTDPEVLSFTMDKLFTPSFGHDISKFILKKLQTFDPLNSKLARFSDVDDVTEMPMDPVVSLIYELPPYSFKKSMLTLDLYRHLSSLILITFFKRYRSRSSWHLQKSWQRQAFRPKICLGLFFRKDHQSALLLVLSREGSFQRLSSPFKGCLTFNSLCQVTI